MRAVLWISVSFLAAVLLAGCKPSVVGKWKFSQSGSGITMEQTVDLQEGGKLAVTGQINGMGQSVPFTASGTWSLDESGDKPTLTIVMADVQAMGQPVPLPDAAKRQSGPVEIEKDKLTWTVTATGATNTIVLTRVTEGK